MCVGNACTRNATLSLLLLFIPLISITSVFDVASSLNAPQSVGRDRYEKCEWKTPKVMLEKRVAFVAILQEVGDLRTLRLSGEFFVVVRDASAPEVFFSKTMSNLHFFYLFKLWFFYFVPGVFLEGRYRYHVQATTKSSSSWCWPSPNSPGQTSSLLSPWISVTCETLVHLWIWVELCSLRHGRH